MYFLKLFFCIFLIKFVEGINSKLFLGSVDQTESSVARCLDLFEENLTKQELKCRSVVILMPDASDDFEVDKIFVESSTRKNLWSVEIWQSTQYGNTHKWFRLNAHQNKYILIQNDTDEDQTTKAFIEKQFSTKNKNELMSSPSICIVKTVRNRNNSIGVKHTDSRCSLFKVSNVADNRLESTGIHVAGFTSSPFAYYDAVKDKLKGIDISLVTTVAVKLKLSMFVHLIGADKSESSNTQSAVDVLVNRYSEISKQTRPNCALMSTHFFRQTHVLLGGLPQHSHILNDFNSSISYLADDYTWCVKRAKLLPLAISFIRIATPAVWILVVCVGYVNGFILYLFVQFDTEPENRKLDLHYTTYLISLPSWIGISQRFNPRHWPLRLYYVITLLFGMVFFAVFCFNLIVRAKVRIRYYQMHTVDELIDMDFRLAGSSAIFENVQNQPLVS